MRAYAHRAFVLALLLTAAVAAPAAAGIVTVFPSAVSVPIGGDRRLTASVNGRASTAVTWSVNDVAGGNAAVGFIDATGKYTAPASATAGSTVTAKATTIASPARSGACVITLRNQIPSVTNLSPRTLPLGPFMIQVMGSRFVNGAQVRLNGVPLTTTFNSPAQLTASGSAAQPGFFNLTVANPGPGAVSSAFVVRVNADRTPTRTATRVNTPVPTRTPTRASTATPRTEPTRAKTPTLPPPTRTATMMPTATARSEPTRTMAPTTASPARTATMMPTKTAPPESTRTMPPTATASAVRTPSMMPTATMRSEPSRTVVPTNTAVRTPTGAPTGAPTTSGGITVGVAPASATVQPGATLQFQATVTGNANQAVTWKVNNTAGGDSTTGTIGPTGLYSAPTTVPFAGAVTVSAVSLINGTSQGTAQVTIQDPLAVTHARLLDQTTFGPTRQLSAHVAQIGIAAFIEEQLALPESPWPSVSTAERGDAVDAFFANALNGQDQLRQRVIYALSEVIVESMNKNTNGEDIVPWLQLLSRNAFGNYRTLLREITLDASMGKYLDLANSGIIGGAPNENYPREVMQLFSIGLYRLNLDGSVQVNAQNVPLPTYAQTDVQQLAKALTGWTYGNPSGTPPGWANSNYYPGPMLPVAAYHNKTAKTILAQSLPANQTAQQDLDGAIDILFQHPNVGPFLATRLIRALVTSNPSPAYVARVATAFNGTGVRGDMKAVIRAILLDPEARNDTPPANFGRLRTPMQHTTALARALGLNLGAASQFAYLFEDMHEGLLDAPSVFGHYSPTYRIPMTGLFGPEFQIYSASDAVNRANLFYWFMYEPWPIDPVLQPFVALAGNAATLVTAVDNALLFGRMLPATRNALLAAMPAMPDNTARVMTAVYLTSMSGEYLVQR